MKILEKIKSFFRKIFLDKKVKKIEEKTKNTEKTVNIIVPNEWLEFNVLIEDDTNITYIIQWNGCISTLYTNSFIHVSKAWDFPSPNLSTEYVIVINGEITIKNPTVNKRFIYMINKAIVVPISITYNIKDPTPLTNIGLKELTINALI